MQTSADRPRFRQDLVAEPIEDGGSKFIDVMDPDSGVLYRFYEVEYSLACAMDGQRDVPGIVRWAEEELGLKPKPDEIRMVISTLGELGYLEGAAAATAPAVAASKPAAAATARPSEPPSRPTPPPTPAGRSTPPAGMPAVQAKTPAGGTPVAAKPQPASNRWDQPTAMGDVDEYLQPGVVAGGAKAASSGVNVELGAPGSRREQSDELPRAPDLELGKPGVAAGARGAAPSKGADIALGASGASGVSVDLADHVDVGAADVKEAVRASQVMKAVDVPPELAEAEKPAAKPAAKVEAKPAEKPAAKVEKAAEKPAAKPVEKAAEKPAAKPVEKPAAKPVEKRPSVTPTAPRSGVSPVLLAALVIAILAAGGFAVYKYVLKKKDTDTSSAVKTPPTPPKKPEPPPPPPVETQKLATEQAPAEELKPSGPGQIATIVANDTVVKAGDPVAKLVGFKSLETDAATLDKALTKAKADSAAAEKERDAAQTAGNKAGVTAAEKKLTTAQKAVEDTQAKVVAKQAALDKFLIKAPAAGKVTAVAKANQKITPTDVVATLTRDPVLVATFKKADGATQDAPVLLAVKGSDQKLACNVVTAAAEGTKIACPKDAAPEGSEVTYAGVDTSRPATPPAGETPTTPEAGSAAGSAASPPAGAGSAAAAPDAGSAAPKAEKVAPKAPPRPRPRPKAKAAGSAAAGGDTAGSATAPAPAPTPAPAGSGGGLQ